MLLKLIKRTLILSALAACFISLCFDEAEAFAAGEQGNTVVLALQDDPYYALAQEIAEAEAIPIFHTFDEAAMADPVYMLWVASPESLTESALLAFSNSLKNNDCAVSVGIISGKSIDEARRLWQEPKQIANRSFALVNATKDNTGVDTQIIVSDGDDTQCLEMNKENILDTLYGIGVIQISMEGAAGSWFNQHLNICIKDTDIPALDSCIVQNFACDTFRPWADNSIALACIRNGAAAYCGFIYSSISGTALSNYIDIDVLNTWPQFTLGQLVQIQNQITMRSYADSPHYFLLGDPRLYYRIDSPYQVVSDKADSGKRVLTLSGAESGLLPIYIEGGAEYSFVRVKGLAAQSMGSIYPNNRLEMIDINGDKYIVIENRSSEFTLELRKNAPVLWSLQNLVIGFLDSIVVRNMSSNLSLASSALVLIFF